jgi:hypothetical protein
VPFAFPRPDIASVEFHVATSPSYAEETVALPDGGILMASLTWRHWGNSIYFFRLRAEAGVPVGYEKPVLPVKPPAIGNRR